MGEGELHIILFDRISIYLSLIFLSDAYFLLEYNLFIMFC